MQSNAVYYFIMIMWNDEMDFIPDRSKAFTLLMKNSRVKRAMY